MRALVVQASPMLLVWVALAGISCRGPALRLEDDRYRGPDVRFSIAPPPGERWERVGVPGTALAFRGVAGGPAEDATLSMLDRCDVPTADPRTLARHLLIGLQERTLEAEAPARVAGAPGWRQSLRATSEGRRVELRTVTRVDGRCTTDWILVAPRVGALLETDFDAWWGSFQPEAGA